MATETDHDLPEPVQGFKRVKAEFYKLTEGSNNGLPYDEGISLSPSDLAAMRVRFDPDARTGFWKFADPITKCALEEAFCDVDELLSTIAMYKREFTECHHPTIKDTYLSTSTGYSRVLDILVLNGMIQNEALRNSSGDHLFGSLGCVSVTPWNFCPVKLTRIHSDAWGWSHWYM